MENGIENVVTTTTTGTIPADLIANGSITIPAQGITIQDVNVKPQEPTKAEPKKDEKPANPELEKLKTALSKANSEAAEYRRMLREKQTEQERAEADRLEQEKSMREELEMLRKEKQVSDYTAKCVALNFEPELAAQTANALADGNMDAMFDCLKAFVEATTTRLNNEALNRQPGLSTGIPPTKQSTDDADLNNLRRYAGLPIHR